jgi:hypothetical protein
LFRHDRHDPSLDDAAALDDSNQDDDNRGHQEDVNETSHGVRGEKTKPPKHEENDCDYPQHGRLLLRSIAEGQANMPRPRGAPQHVRHGLRGQPRNLTRIGAVLCGSVEHGQYQLTEGDGLSRLGLHVFLPFVGSAHSDFVLQCGEVFGLHTHLQHVLGHDQVGNENAHLHQKCFSLLVSSINVT